jgi:hypothetical protein
MTSFAVWGRQHAAAFGDYKGLLVSLRQPTSQSPLERLTIFAHRVQLITVTYFGLVGVLKMFVQ